MENLEIYGRSAERFVLRDLRYERAASGDYFDSNWLLCSVSVTQSMFSASVGVSMQVSDLVQFLRQIDLLLSAGATSAVLQTIEDTLRLEFRELGGGRTQVSGKLVELNCPRLFLQFEFLADGSVVAQTREFLEFAVRAFPSRPGE